jgi:hypothetical protein
MDQSLGALDGGQLSLGSLDDAPDAGADARRTGAGDRGAGRSTAPNDRGNSAEDNLSASFGPAQPQPQPRPLQRDDAPIDLFAPPGEAQDETVVELAPEELAHRARKQHSAPPIALEPPSLPTLPQVRRAGPSPPPPSLVRPQPALAGALAARPGSSQPPAMAPASAAPTGVVALAGRLLPTPRARFAAGVLLSIAVGFLPATAIASLQEHSAFRTIDAQVIALQAAADTPQAYETLDAFRADQLAAKHRARSSAMITSLLLWAAVSAGAAYVWFRRLPWHQLD